MPVSLSGWVASCEPGPATSVSATGGVGVIVISDEQGAQHFLEIKRHGIREIPPGQATISIDGR
jgi:hypothetical protein